MGHRSEDVLITRGREVVQSFLREKTTQDEQQLEVKINGKRIENSQNITWSWEEMVNGHIQSGQLLDSIERNIYKLLEVMMYSSNGMKTASASSSHLAAPVVQNLRHLIRQKQQLEENIMHALHGFGPPLIVENDKQNGKSEECINWISQPQISRFVENQTDSLQQQLSSAKNEIHDMHIKLNAYKTQLIAMQHLSNNEQQNMPQNGKIIVMESAKANIASSNLIHQRKLENELQEKEELLRALRSTVDHVAKDRSVLESQIKTQNMQIQHLEIESQKLRQMLQSNSKKIQQIPKSQNNERDFDESKRSTEQLEINHVNPQATDAAENYSLELIDIAQISETVPEDDGSPSHRVEDFETPLPSGWEMRVTATGDVFFVHQLTRRTTWSDPRTSNQPKPELDSIPIQNAEIYCVEFEESGPIGLLFQANIPDKGASVRQVVDGMSAATSGKVKSGKFVLHFFQILLWF